MTLRFFTLALFALMLASVPASAQGTQIAFGSKGQDTTLPVEITADQLNIDQAHGTAIFTGNVLVGQGEMRLSAGAVRVEYAMLNGKSTGKIARLLATDGVTLVSGTEAAEAKQADYTIDSGDVVMTGNVILTQGQNALSSDRMVINLKTGTGTMDGSVKTVLRPQSSGAATPGGN